MPLRRGYLWRLAAGILHPPRLFRDAGPPRDYGALRGGAPDLALMGLALVYASREVRP
jgi:hypothetical protein